MTDQPQQISFRRDGPHSWRVTYDGRTLGDSRGYDRAGAFAAACAIVDAEHALARIEGRHSRKVLRPELPGWRSA